MYSFFIFLLKVEEGNCPECEYNNELGGSEALKLHLIKIHYHDELKAKYSSGINFNIVAKPFNNIFHFDI